MERELPRSAVKGTPQQTERRWWPNHPRGQMVQQLLTRRTSIGQGLRLQRGPEMMENDEARRCWGQKPANGDGTRTLRQPS